MRSAAKWSTPIDGGLLKIRFEVWTLFLDFTFVMVFTFLCLFQSPSIWEINKNWQDTPVEGQEKISWNLAFDRTGVFIPEDIDNWIGDGAGCAWRWGALHAYVQMNEVLPRHWTGSKSRKRKDKAVSCKEIIQKKFSSSFSRQSSETK